MSDVLPAELSLLDSVWRPCDAPLARAAVEGRFVDVLSSPTCPSLCKRQGFAVDLQNVEPLDLLAIAVSLLQAFLQTNWTGPEVDFEPSQLFDGPEDEGELNAAAIAELTLLGEPAYHLARKATFLLLARRLLENEAFPPLATLPVWRLRAHIVHLRILDEPVPIPQEVLEAAEAVRDGPLAKEADIAAGITLSLGLYHALASRSQPAFDKKASELSHQAAAEAGFEYELTGRLGKRTRFQVKETSQLVVLARSRPRTDWQPRTKREVNKEEDMPQTLALNDDTLLEKTQFSASTLPSSLVTLDRTPLNEVKPDEQPPLHPHDQAILLGLSLNVGNSAPTHGLTSHQIGAFVTRVLEDVENWSVHSMALLLRSRLEASRSRTVERGLLQMQSLVDQLKLTGTSVADEAEGATHERGANASERLAYIHSLALPSRWELEAELARRYRGLGVVRSALDIYERLELWEDAALCHAAAGRKDRAVALVQDLLEGNKVDAEAATPAARRAIPEKARAAKLWCTLGDLEGDPAHYAKAWEVSGGSSSRAMRGMGGHYFKDGKFVEAKDALRSALAINPLYIRTWFILGCAAMKAEDWSTAEEAFGRCVALDDEDGEGWSNLASVHLRLAATAATPDEAYARRRAAHTAFKHATRVAYESWRIWQNYLAASLAIGELLEVVRALGRIADLRADKDGEAVIDLDALDVVVDAALGRSGTMSADGQAEAQIKALPPRLRDLFDRSLLPAITNSPRLYRAHARFLLGQGDPKGSLAAHLSAYRCGPAQAAAAELDRDAFVAGVAAVQDIVDALEALGPRDVEGGGVVDKEWRYQARSIVRSFLGRTKSAFEDEPEYERLKEVVKELSSR